MTYEREILKSHEKEILKSLRQSLDQEEDETSIIPILESHHKYLKEYIGILSQPNSSSREKQETAKLLFTIFEMHARAEENTLYDILKLSKNHDVRLEGLRNYDEHLIAHEIITELKNMGYLNLWSDKIEAKMNVLTGMISTHLMGEEKIMFPMSEKYITEEQLMDLADDYLEQCRAYLDKKMDGIPSDVSRSDVMTFLY